MSLKISYGCCYRYVNTGLVSCLLYQGMKQDVKVLALLLTDAFDYCV
jgi:hypothetical protein